MKNMGSTEFESIIMRIMKEGKLYPAILEEAEKKLTPEELEGLEKWLNDNPKYKEPAK
jgi:hypothetical protein